MWNDGKGDRQTTRQTRANHQPVQPVLCPVERASIVYSLLILFGRQHVHICALSSRSLAPQQAHGSLALSLLVVAQNGGYFCCVRRTVPVLQRIVGDDVVEEVKTIFIACLLPHCSACCSTGVQFVVLARSLGCSSVLLSRSLSLSLALQNLLCEFCAIQNPASIFARPRDGCRREKKSKHHHIPGSGDRFNSTPRGCSVRPGRDLFPCSCTLVAHSPRLVVCFSLVGVPPFFNAQTLKVVMGLAQRGGCKM